MPTWRRALCFGLGLALVGAGLWAFMIAWDGSPKPFLVVSAAGMCCFVGAALAFGGLSGRP